MANLNSVHLIGRLTKDPVLRHTNNDTPVTEISLAINREFTVADGTRKKEACFVDIVFWARQAEVVAKHLKTGSEIFVRGRLELDQWTGPDDQKRSRLRVVSEGFQFLDKVKRATNGNGNGGGDSSGESGDEEAAWDKAAAEVSDQPVPTD